MVDIGDGLVAVFKMESHNHPSFIEPYQGAATGVGGILRDVFTMGARPMALLDSLRFGDPTHPKTRHLLAGVVAGIGGYGNCVGVPTVGGECTFHRAYNGNILVNAMCVGVARADRIFYAKASGVGNPVVYVGAKTGRDGIHGATMASAEFSDETEAKRPTVQVGDPFTEKLLIEACLELMAKDCIVAIQDMGAAGLTSSSFEMAARGEAGIELDLDRVPLRETGMTPYEIMLSESQERMLMVLEDGREAEALAVFAKWGLDCAVVGRVTDTGRMVLALAGQDRRRRAGGAGQRRLAGLRPPVEPTPQARADAGQRPRGRGAARRGAAAAARLARPRQQALDLGAVRPHGHGRHGAAAGRRRRGGPRPRHRPRPGAHDRLHAPLLLRRSRSRRHGRRWPRRGATWSRRRARRSRSPTASTSATPSGRGSWASSSAASTAWPTACRALDFPVVSGNVSLYNETDGNAILPTPERRRPRPDRRSGAHGRDRLARGPASSLVLLGECLGWLGCSLYWQLLVGRDDGAPPPVDLAAERRTGEFVLGQIGAGRVARLPRPRRRRARRGRGGDVPGQRHRAPRSSSPADAASVTGWWFGEDQGRYLLAVSPHDAPELLAAAAAAGVHRPRGRRAPAATR